MRFLTTIIIFFFMTGCLLAQEVSNVRVQQRTDGNFFVDIWYNLGYSGDNMITVFIEASSDNGATWALECSNLTGDIGGYIMPGTDKHVVWDFYADNPNVSGNQYKVRVTASDEYMMGNDGKIYKTVKIGNQVWMAENLRETLYRNGDPIPEELNGYDWPFFTSGARCSYDNSESVAEIYGYLYNWYAAVDARHIAPEGWHVPSDTDWNILRSYLGPNSIHSGAGGKMKETGTVHWGSPNDGATNESGFTALPAGYRFGEDTPYTGFFSALQNSTYYWNSTSSTIENVEMLSQYHAMLEHEYYQKTCGLSIRLIKDNEE